MNQYKKINKNNTFYPREEMNNLQQSFKCPITHQIMKNPVVCSDGHTYQKQAIQKWLIDHEKSPMTTQILKKKFIKPNHALRNAIQQYLRDPKQKINFRVQTKFQLLTLQSGSHYQGQVFNGRPHGKGIEKNENFQYEGQFRRGERHGRGRLEDWSLGIIYEGKWRNGKYYGSGVQKIIKNKKVVSKYNGVWKEGKMEGRGIFENLQKQIRYQGQWEKGLKHGNGRLTFLKTGQIYQGQFRNNRVHGIATYCKDGQKYSGTFYNGKPDGEGTLTTKQGRKITKVYDNGKQVK